MKDAIQCKQFRHAKVENRIELVCLSLLSLHTKINQPRFHN